MHGQLVLVLGHVSTNVSQLFTQGNYSTFNEPPTHQYFNFKEVNMSASKCLRRLFRLISDSCTRWMSKLSWLYVILRNWSSKLRTAYNVTATSNNQRQPIRLEGPINKADGFYCTGWINVLFLCRHLGILRVLEIPIWTKLKLQVSRFKIISLCSTTPWKSRPKNGGVLFICGCCKRRLINYVRG